MLYTDVKIGEKNMNLGDRIKLKRKEKNKTLEEVGKIVGVTKATIQRYENGNILNIPSDKIELLAKALDTTPSYLMGWEEENGIDLQKIPGIKIVKNLINVPILGTVVCGMPAMSEENFQGYFKLDPEIGEPDFCLYAEGDSMIDAGIHEGDIVFFKKTPEVENGTIACILLDDKITLKSIYKTDQNLILQPQNKAYSPIIVNEGDYSTVMILGQMIGVYSARSR